MIHASKSEFKIILTNNLNYYNLFYYAWVQEYQQFEEKVISLLHRVCSVAAGLRIVKEKVEYNSFKKRNLCRTEMNMNQALNRQLPVLIEKGYCHLQECPEAWEPQFSQLR
jgi:hypothetical protein